MNHQEKEALERNGKEESLEEGNTIIKLMRAETKRRQIFLFTAIYDPSCEHHARFP